MLKILGLRVVALLPGQLSDERIAEPDVHEGGIAAIVKLRLILEDVAAPMIAMHESPGLVDSLTLNNLGDHICKTQSKGQEFRVYASRVNDWVSLLSQGKWNLEICVVIIVPPIFDGLHQHKVDGLYSFICIGG